MARDKKINLKALDLADLNIELTDNVRAGVGIQAKLSDILVVKDTIYDFPNVGSKQYLYLDSSTGDLYAYGYTGNFYISVGTANGDTIDGGDATTTFQEEK